MNYSITTHAANIPVHLGSFYICGDPVDVTEVINSDTTIEEFDLKCLEKEEYALNWASKDGWTPLARAVKVVNLVLMEYLVEKAGPSLFLIQTKKGLSPLHIAGKNENHEQGYLAGKTLVKLGSPVNIIQAWTGKSAVDIAIKNGSNKLAGFLLRHGAIPNAYLNIEAAKNEMLTKTEKLFAMHMNDQRLKGEIDMPKEIVNYIISLAGKAELKD
jgi:hypothetical protein